MNAARLESRLSTGCVSLVTILSGVRASEGCNSEMAVRKQRGPTPQIAVESSHSQLLRPGLLIKADRPRQPLTESSLLIG